MKQLCIKGIIILLIVFVIDIVTGTVHKSIFAKLPDKDYAVSAIGQMLMHKNAQLLVLGSSSADRHYDPQLMSDSLGIEVYNGGLAGHDIIYCDLILRGMMERQKPDCIVLDVRPGILDGSFLGANSDFYPFYGISEAVTHHFKNETDWQQRLKMLSGLYRNNGSLETLSRIYRGDDNTTRGYRPLERKMDHIELTVVSDFNVNGAEIHSLQELVKTCKDEHMKLFFCKSPCTVKNTSFNTWIKDFCQENEIVLIDEDENTLYYQHPEWFYDAYHLNKEGAHYYSRIISHRLKGIINNI